MLIGGRQGGSAGFSNLEPESVFTRSVPDLLFVLKSPLGIFCLPKAGGVWFAGFVDLGTAVTYIDRFGFTGRVKPEPAEFATLCADAEKEGVLLLDDLSREIGRRRKADG